MGFPHPKTTVAKLAGAKSNMAAVVARIPEAKWKESQRRAMARMVPATKIANVAFAA
jgi:hypothetical protein